MRAAKYAFGTLVRRNKDKDVTRRRFLLWLASAILCDKPSNEMLDVLGRYGVPGSDSDADKPTTYLPGRGL